MRLSSLPKKKWGHPLSKNLDVEHPDSIAVHHTIIKSKPLLKSVYLEWYGEFMAAEYATRHLDAPTLEIGCGAGFLEEVIPGLIKTDVVQTPFVHRVMDAEKLDFPDVSLRAIFMIHTLHHIHFPANFFAEALRCLKPGGRLVMVEPSNGFLLRFLAKWTDHFEYFDDKIEEWKNRSNERMIDANMAIPWVIFNRDRARFEREFAQLKILDIGYHTFLSYFISGGIGYRSFLPGFCLPMVRFIETLAKPFGPKLATMMTIDIEKRSAR